MPDCRSCPHLTGDGNSSFCALAPFTWEGAYHPERGKRKTAAMSCVIAAFQHHLPDMVGDVLEIGPGIYRGFRKAIFAKPDAQYHGVEARWGSEKYNISRGKVSKMPFQDSTFDWVFGFSTIEHWHEFGDSIESGLAEIYRVLKPGGKLLVTAPIHLHGHEMFLLGRLDEFRSKFVQSDWTIERFESWRKEYSPLPKMEEWVIRPKEMQMMMRMNGGVMPSMYTIEVLATRN